MEINNGFNFKDQAKIDIIKVLKDLKFGKDQEGVEILGFVIEELKKKGSDRNFLDLVDFENKFVMKD